MTTNPFLHLLQIQLHRLRTPAGVLLENQVFAVPGGAVHTVMGPSGSGKSSLLAAVCGTLDAGWELEGTVVLNGMRIDHLPTHRRRVGLLLQDDLLFAHLTVLENLLFAIPGGPQAVRKARALDALAEVELPAFSDADPATLSGGQRARVALARALLAEPQALMLDEPFSKLDAPLRQRMRTLVFGAVEKRGIPAILVSHDAADVADTQRLTMLV
ncbi:MAG: ATP-binding cassette domain-containing protein [Rhodoferax sp.]